MKFSSMRFRLLLWNIGILAIALLSFLLLAHITIRARLQADMDKRLTGISEGMVHFYARDDVDTSREPPRLNRPPRGRSRTPRMVRAFDRLGHPLPHPGPPSTTPELPWDRIAYARGMAGATVFSIVRDNEGQLLRVLTCPLVRNNTPMGVLQVATSYEEMQSLLNSLTAIMLILVPCVLLVAGAGGMVLTDRALRPIRQIIRSAETLKPDDLSQRLPVIGTDEFARLAITMNGMLFRIEKAFDGLRFALERERRFTSDASHELRTPLTAIMANATLTLSGEATPEEYRESMQAISLAATLMRRLVEALLLLARSDSGQLAPEYTEIDVQDLFALAMTLVRKDLPQAPIQTKVADEAMTLCGDVDQLQRLLMNLLENALRYTPAEGQVTLSASRAEGATVISVADSGEGIAPEHLAHLGERFYRVEAARSRQHGGYGLGLAICKGIVEAHHGKMTIASTPGQGTTVTVYLPDRTI